MLLASEGPFEAITNTFNTTLATNVCHDDDAIKGGGKKETVEEEKEFARGKIGQSRASG